MRQLRYAHKTNKKKNSVFSWVQADRSFVLLLVKQYWQATIRVSGTTDRIDINPFNDKTI